MEKEIDFDNGELDMLECYLKVIQLSDLKKWVETQMSKGKTKVRMNLSWGACDNVEELKLIAE